MAPNMTIPIQTTRFFGLPATDAALAKLSRVADTSLSIYEPIVRAATSGQQGWDDSAFLRDHISHRPGHVATTINLRTPKRGDFPCNAASVAFIVGGVRAVKDLRFADLDPERSRIPGIPMVSHETPQLLVVGNLLLGALLLVPLAAETRMQVGVSERSQPAQPLTPLAGPTRVELRGAGIVSVLFHRLGIPVRELLLRLSPHHLAPTVGIPAPQEIVPPRSDDPTTPW